YPGICDELLGRGRRLDEVSQRILEAVWAVDSGQTYRCIPHRWERFLALAVGVAAQLASCPSSGGLHHGPRDRDSRECRDERLGRYYQGGRRAARYRLWRLVHST